MAEDTPRETTTSAPPVASSGGFRSAERWDAEARAAAEPADDGPSPRAVRLARLYVAGAAMLAVTMLTLALGGPGLLAAALGVVGFLLVLRLAPSRLGEGDVALGPASRRVAAAPGVDAPRVAAELAKAETELVAIDSVAVRLGADPRRRPLAEAMRAQTTQARAVLDEIARDPADLERARKFLVVVLPSMRAAAEKFAANGVIDDTLDGRFRALVDEVATACRRQLDNLRMDERLDLEVEMEVLADRVKGGA